MTTDPDDAIRLIQSGLDKLGHTPGAIDGHWGVRTARALRQLIAANGRAASVAPQGPLPWITEAKTALGRKEARDRTWLMDWLKRDGRSLGERERQIGRISAALDVGANLTSKIIELEKRIEPLQERVDEMARSIDFSASASLLEDGMNEYLSAINQLRPEVWRHSAVKIDLSKSGFTMRVGARRWQAALGGTDTLYFLMAYQYGLLTLSDKSGCHFPGLAIIDVPGEFSGEEVEDKENFIVQPFISLLNQEQYSGAQLIITGASFTGLVGAHFQRLTRVHVA